MRLLRKYNLILILTSLFLGRYSSALSQIVLNEVSNGNTGAKEYVELVTTGNLSCNGTTTVDLRGFYLDDNNGTFASGSGTGIAMGCVRFKNNAFWSAIPIGTLILIYNDFDKNLSISLQVDSSLTDGNCRLVLPVEACNLFEVHITQPSLTNSAYPTSGFVNCGLWSETTGGASGPLGLANGGDSFQIRDASGNLLHAVSYGNNTTSTIIAFAGSGQNSNYSFTNNTNNNPALQANWTKGCSNTAVCGTNNETPGLPNNIANANWIKSLNNNCTPFIPLNITTSFSQPTCYNSCNGSITINAQNGWGNYQYVWNTGDTSSNLNNLCAGTYTCTIIDSFGCNLDTTVILTDPAPVSVSAIAPAAICDYESTTITASGANTYSWSPLTGIVSNNGASILVSHTSNIIYTVIGYDLNNCPDTATVQLTVNNAPLVNAGLDVTLCPGNSTHINASGANTFSWNTGTTNSSFTVSPASTTSYTVIGYSLAGCKDTDEVTVTINSVVTASISGDTVLCLGESTSLTAMGANTYSWTSSSGALLGTSNPFTFSPLTTSSYTLIGVAGTACSDTLVFNILINANPSVNTTPNDTVCFLEAATIGASGLTSGTYNWYQNNSLLHSGVSLTQVVTSTQTYTVIGTDSNGCSDTNTVTLSHFPVLTAQVNDTSVCFGTNGQLTCLANNTINTYSWYNGGSYADNTNPLLITGNISNLYTVIVTDQYGCKDTATGNYTVNPDFTLTVNGNGTLCLNDFGLITCTTNANLPTYSWTGYNIQNTPLGSSISIGADSVGTFNYMVFVTDSSGCIKNSTFSVTINPLPNISAQNDTVCIGNTFSLTANGASTYTWSNGFNGNPCIGPGVTDDSLLVTGTDVNGCRNTHTVYIDVLTPVALNGFPDSTLICAGDTVVLTVTPTGNPILNWTNAPTLITNNQTALAFPANTSIYTVTGTNGYCSDTANFYVNVVEPTTLTITASKDSVCSGETVGLMVTPNNLLNYTWLSSSTITAATTTTPVLLPSTGTTPVYLVATDGVCVMADSLFIYTEAPVITHLPLTSDKICYGDTLSIQLPITTASYSWSPSENSSAPGNIYNFTPSNSTNYILTTYTTLCADTEHIFIQVNTPLTLSATTSDSILCLGDTTQLLATGGSLYTWISQQPVNNSNSAAITINPTLSSTYYILASDAEGVCVAADSIRILVNPLPLVEAGPSKSICLGDSVTLTPVTPALSCNWSNGTSNCNNLVYPNTSTQYILTQTDLNGCRNTDSISVFVNALPAPVLTAFPVCLGDSSFVTITNPGGSNWTNIYVNYNDGSAIDSLFPFAHSYTSCGAQTATISIINTDGCSYSSTLNQTVNCIPIANLQLNDTLFCMYQTLNGSAITLGNPPATNYSWTLDTTLFASSNINTQLEQPGDFKVTLIAENAGCKDTTTKTIKVSALPQADFTFTNVCLNELNHYQNTTTPPAGSTLAGYIWDFDSDGQLDDTTANTMALFNQAGIYNSTLYVVSSDGCLDSVTKQVEVYALPVAQFSSTSACQNSPLTLSAAGNPANTYNWDLNQDESNDLIGQQITLPDAGTDSLKIKLTVQNAFGCKDSSYQSIGLYPLPEANFSSDTTWGCAPFCVQFTGSATINGLPVSPTYFWIWEGENTEQSTGNTSHCYNSKGDYDVGIIAQTIYGCRDTLIKPNYISAHESPTADFNYTPLDDLSELNPTVFFENTTLFNNNGSYLWDFNYHKGKQTDSSYSSTLVNPDFTYADTGKYCIQLIAVNEFGCKDSTLNCLYIKPDFAVYIPNTFTPTGDLLNDTFKPSGIGLNNAKEYNFRIFDRWGLMIYEGKEYQTGWDGNYKGLKCPIDIYAYTLSFTDREGRKREYSGTVNLIK